VTSVDDNKQGVLKLTLRYDGRTGPAARSPACAGCRVRASAPMFPPKQVPRVRNGLGIAILSTSQGVMTDKEARHQGRRRRSPLRGLVNHVAHRS
jgi:Ribosomal protein S8